MPLFPRLGDPRLDSLIEREVFGNAYVGAPPPYSSDEVLADQIIERLKSPTRLCLIDLTEPTTPRHGRALYGPRAVLERAIRCTWVQGPPEFAGILEAFAGRPEEDSRQLLATFDQVRMWSATAETRAVGVCRASLRMLDVPLP